MIRHHFTVDVEEYFHPTAVARHYPMPGWNGLERRSPRVIARLLAFLSDHGVKATFFVLGWLAEREPEMVRSIVRAGHEIASHGYVLTPGRYVGAEEAEEDGEPFEEKMPRLVAELNAQFAESAKLEQAIKANLRGLGYGG